MKLSGAKSRLPELSEERAKARKAGKAHRRKAGEITEKL